MKFDTKFIDYELHSKIVINILKSEVIVFYLIYLLEDIFYIRNRFE